jgi:hypothetical protein
MGNVESVHNYEEENAFLDDLLRIPPRCVEILRHDESDDGPEDILSMVNDIPPQFQETALKHCDIAVRTQVQPHPPSSLFVWLLERCDEPMSVLHLPWPEYQVDNPDALARLVADARISNHHLETISRRYRLESGMNQVLPVVLFLATPTENHTMYIDRCTLLNLPPENGPKVAERYVPECLS